jgi:CBS domain-containing protein
MDENHGPMIACDIMISNFSFVGPEDKVGDVIRLLRESRLGAVSVIDGDHRPIGIITRSNVEGSPPAAAEIAGAPPSFLLRAHGAWRAPTVNLNRHAREVMTTPTISVSDVAQLLEIARIMETHRLKRIPVMSGARMVGMVNRARVMEAMAKAPATPAAASQVPHAIERAGDALPSAGDFRSLVAAHERLEEEAIRQGHIAARAVLKARIDEMAARRLSDRDWRALLESARRAAAAGLPECVLLRFSVTALLRRGRLQCAGFELAAKPSRRGGGYF